MTKKLLTVFAVRPEAIKTAPVALAIQKADGVESIVCVSAQHRQMLDQVLTDKDLYARMSNAHNPYGDGNACEDHRKIGTT